MQSLGQGGHSVWMAADLYPAAPGTVDIGLSEGAHLAPLRGPICLVDTQAGPAQNWNEDADWSGSVTPPSGSMLPISQFMPAWFAPTLGLRQGSPIVASL